MQTPGTSPAKSRDPDATALLRVLRNLADAKDWIGVIRLVERWSELAQIPRDARILQARALMALRLMDRAWVRLREVTDVDADDLEAQVLTAEMFVERGWPARARKVLQRVGQLAPDLPGLADLNERASQPPLQPPTDAQDVERGGTVGEQLALAERYLATGSIIRARSLLEKVKRRADDSRRVDELLWGIRGDFEGGHQSLAELVEELHQRDALSEWDQPDNTESIDLSDISLPDPETAEVGRAGMPEGRDNGGFPTLFRKRGEPGGDDARPREDDEVTVAAVMASSDEMANPPPEEVTDAGGFEEDRGDTQIMQVIPSGDGASLVPMMGGEIHRRDEPDGARPTLDLRSWQQSMGMTPVAAPDDPAGEEAGDEDFLEEEDQDLVVMTRREAPDDDPTERPEQRRGPIEVIEKVPVPEVEPAPAEPVEEARPEPDEPFSDEVEVPASPVGRRQAVGRRWNRLFAGLAIMALLMAGVSFMVIQFFAVAAGDDIVREVHRTLAAGDSRAVADLESSLDAQVSAGRIPVGVRAAELALVRAVLWREYTGDPRDRKGSEEALAVAQGSTAPSQELALARAILYLTDGDLVRAAQASERSGRGNAEARRVAAEIALERGDGAGAYEAWGGADAPTEGIRHAVLVPRILMAAGHPEAALALGRTLLRDAGEQVEVVLAAYEQGWVEGAARARLERLDRFYQERQDVLTPRQAGRVYAARAALLEQLGQQEDALRAWQKALSVDGNNPRYRYVLGVSHLLGTRAMSAHDQLARCIEQFPLDRDCTRGEIQVLLDLDRVEQARVVVDRWNERGQGRLAVEGWVLVAEERYEEAVIFAKGMLAGGSDEDPDAVRRQERGRHLYTLGVAWGELRSSRPDQPSQALEMCAGILDDSADPLDRMLAVRAAAAAALYSPADLSSGRLRELDARADTDPVAQVFLARYYYQRGDRTRASRHFAEAVSNGPENGIAQFWSGFYHYGSRIDARTGESSWRRYLDLGPSGKRRQVVESSAAFKGNKR